MINNIICFLCGKTGCGKSYTLNYILHREYELKRRKGIVVWDLRDDHLNLLKLSDFYYLKISPLIFHYYDLDWSGILQKYPYLIISPYKLSTEECEILVDDIAKGIIDIGNRIFVLEEAGVAFPVYAGIRRIRRNLSVLIATGRKLGIDIYFTSQRPQQVASIAISQANIRISFQLTDHNDLARVNSYFENVDISKLERFQFVARNDFTNEQIIGSTDNLKVLDKILWQGLQ
jgi:hypothetical protein